MSQNKALHMGPHVSHLVGSVRENSATEGSSGFPNGHLPGMDAAILLLALKQGTRSLERYIAEYLALANGSELPDCMLIDFFCDGLNQTVRSKLIPQGPCSSRSNFLDYVLLTVGSAFTVGVAEERDTALNCMITLYDPNCMITYNDHCMITIARARSQNGGDSGARSKNGGHNNTPSCHCCQS